MTTVKGKQVETPECDKMLSVRRDSQVIGEFLDWLGEHDWSRMRWAETRDEEECHFISRPGGPGSGVLAGKCIGGKLVRGLAYEEMYQDDCPKCDGTGFVTRITEGWVRDPRSIEQVLADYFEIDLAKAEREKLSILDALREEE